MLKAALFDLDGVIFDTEPQYTTFWGSQFRRYYPDRPGLEHAIKGQTLTQIYDAWFAGALEAERPAITDRLNDYERQMTFPYIAGFLSLIDDLRRHAIPTAVVTSSNAEKMARVHEQHPEFRALIDVILTSEDFAFSKPHPDRKHRFRGQHQWPPCWSRLGCNRCCPHYQPLSRRLTPTLRFPDS